MFNYRAEKMEVISSFLCVSGHLQVEGSKLVDKIHLEKKTLTSGLVRSVTECYQSQWKI